MGSLLYPGSPEKGLEATIPILKPQGSSKFLEETVSHGFHPPPVTLLGGEGRRPHAPHRHTERRVHGSTGSEPEGLGDIASPIPLFYTPGRAGTMAGPQKGASRSTARTQASWAVQFPLDRTFPFPSSPQRGALDLESGDLCLLPSL